MSLIYKRRANEPSFMHGVYDYYGEIVHFAKRIRRPHIALPLILLKTIEWAIYRWYKTPIRRFYGVKGNELIYMMTRRCNDRCAKCGIWRDPESNAEHLPMESFLNCLYRLHENLYQLTLTGGEPLMYAADVLTLAKEAKKLEVPMVTVTNGRLLTKEFLDIYAASGNILVISLDTLDKSKWLEFRGRQHFDRVMGNIILARDILGSQLRIQSVLADESKADVLAVKEFCNQHDIPHVVQPYMDFGGYWHGVNEHEVTDLPCAARKNICIYPNGDVVKCFDHHRIPLAKEPLGNIAEEDIVTILCKKRSTEVSAIMKNCDLPCKQMSCNIPKEIYA